MTGSLVRSLLGMLVLCLLFGAPPVAADSPPPTGIAFEQKLDAQIPLALSFRDERDAAVHLSDYFGARPVILTLNYLRCTNFCPLELQALTTALGQLPFNLGDQYDVLTVSIDARDTPVVAAGKRTLVLGQYNRPGAAAGWHFLTGDAAAIAALAHAVGFQYAYDAQNDDYAHPLGIMVLTPQGKVARYLYGVDYPARDLRLALVEASQNRISSPADRFLLFCYHYDAAAGRYSAAAMNFVQLGALVGLVALAGFLFPLWRMEARNRRR